MINKVHFGKRIAQHRKRLQLSQAELAEKLSITAQAVSKWECAAALPDIDLLLELSHLYGVSVNELLEGNDIFAKLTDKPYTLDEIAYFIPHAERPDSIAWAKTCVQEGWIAENWEYSLHHGNPMRADAGAKIAHHGGTILEIGLGPGGGFMPYILKNDPDATLIINDLSPTVVNEWKHLLDCELNTPNISYAAFNFCNIPFKDNSIDVVSDCAGIGNTEDGEKGDALKEVYRVLKPGGLFVTTTGFVTKETLAVLPEHVQQILKEKGFLDFPRSI